MRVLLLWIFIGISLASEEKQWPWNPDKEELDLGKHATFTELIGKHNDTIQILTDTQHKYMAIKDHNFQGCYLIDIQVSHMSSDEIIKGIKKHGVPVLPGEFDVKYPNIHHTAVQEQFGPRIGHFCKYNPTTWLVKHVPITHSEL